MILPNREIYSFRDLTQVKVLDLTKNIAINLKEFIVPDLTCIIKLGNKYYHYYKVDNFQPKLKTIDYHRLLISEDNINSMTLHFDKKIGVNHTIRFLDLYRKIKILDTEKIIVYNLTKQIRKNKIQEIFNE